VLHIFVDADACPVKEEIYRVARRYGLGVTLVANAAMRIPHEKGIRLQVVGGRFDAADDWIVENIEAFDILVTADVLLASRCVAKKASVLGPGGKPFTESNIGDVVASRNLLAELRGAGEITGGPKPMGPKERSRFLQKLDEAIQVIRRENPSECVKT
jgi:uncharacterized protein YaiI (UPF0178 family)